EVGVAEEDAAGGELRHRMVVVELELRIRADFRGDVQVGKRAERVLLRRTAVVVVRSEVELVRGVDERPRIAGGIQRIVRGGFTIQPEAAGKGGPGTAASGGVARTERQCADATA